MAKKKIFIMLTGLPASGKTTARKLLSQYLYHIYGIKSQIINKGEIRLDIQATNTKMNMDEINAAAKRSSMSMLSCWKSDPKFPVCIWDNISQDVFSRMPILDELKTNEDDILICALHMNRDLQFCRKHNNDPDRNPVPDKVVNIWGRRYQQPIYEEGFHIIYHIDGTHKLTPEKFMCRVMDFPLDIPELNKPTV